VVSEGKLWRRVMGEGYFLAFFNYKGLKLLLPWWERAGVRGRKTIYLFVFNLLIMTFFLHLLEAQTRRRINFSL